MNESSLTCECDMSSFNRFTPQQVAPEIVGGFQLQPLSSESYTSYPSFHPVETSSHIGFIERPKKMQKINSWNSRTTEQNPTLVPGDVFLADSLLFHNPKPTNDVFGRALASQEGMRALVSNASAQNHETLAQQGSKMTNMGSMLSQAQEHIIAERKRREKLSQRFIALSAAIPGLKKVVGLN